MLQPDPYAMLTGAILFFAVLLVTLAVTAVRRRRLARTESRPGGERRFAG